MILDLDQYAEANGNKTKEEILHSLRQDYCTAVRIASLATTELRAKDPALLEFIDLELSYRFDDLGNCFYDCWSGIKNALMNGTRLATAPTTDDLRDKLVNRAAIVLGAGPGVTPRWDDIKAAQGKAVLFCCDVMLEPCLKRGIIPDYICTIERVPASFECMQGMDKTGITVLAPPVIESRVVDDFDGRVIWCWRGCGLEIWLDHSVHRHDFGRSCGTQGVAAALIAGCNPIYLVGHDLCMDGDKTHCDDAQATTKGTAENLDTDEYHRRIPAKSISGRDVTTIRLWGMFKNDIEHILSLHPTHMVINTGDGLPITGTYPGSLPPGWGDPVALPTITRAQYGRDPSELIQLMLDDIPILKQRYREVLELSEPDHRKLIISSMVNPKTAQAWTEIYASIYVPALVRLYLDPSQHLAMLKRVAKTTLCTLDFIEKELHGIKNP